MLLLALLGCPPSSEPEPEPGSEPDVATYDASCSAPSDCEVVPSSTCDCTCDVAALSHTGAAAFLADEEAWWAAQEHGCGLGCEPYCAPVSADCEAGACVVVSGDTG